MSAKNYGCLHQMCCMSSKVHDICDSVQQVILRISQLYTHWNVDIEKSDSFSFGWCSDGSVFQIEHISVKSPFLWSVLHFHSVSVVCDVENPYRLHSSSNRIGAFTTESKMFIGEFFFSLFLSILSLKQFFKNGDLLTKKSNSITCYSFHWTQKWWLACNKILLVKKKISI